MGFKWSAVSCRLSLDLLSFLSTSPDIFWSITSQTQVETFCPVILSPSSPLSLSLSPLDLPSGLQVQRWNHCLHCPLNSLGSAHCNPVLAFPMVLHPQHLSQFLWMQSASLPAHFGLPHVSFCFSFQRTQFSISPFTCILSFNTAILSTYYTLGSRLEAGMHQASPSPKAWKDRPETKPGTQRKKFGGVSGNKGEWPTLSRGGSRLFRQRREERSVLGRGNCIYKVEEALVSLEFYGV